MFVELFNQYHYIKYNSNKHLIHYKYSSYIFVLVLIQEEEVRNNIECHFNSFPLINVYSIIQNDGLNLDLSIQLDQYISSNITFHRSIRGERFDTMKSRIHYPIMPMICIPIFSSDNIFSYFHNKLEWQECQNTSRCEESNRAGSVEEPQVPIKKRQLKIFEDIETKGKTTKAWKPKEKADTSKEKILQLFAPIAKYHMQSLSNDTCVGSLKIANGDLLQFALVVHL
ncbi:hypothetical protein RFI_01531 [Reticulomyxa filosa]|uniref:Uncharacterized protein n=1 Tax=Reticulomyxa filosa TaxID=46433 RepID=X6PCY2_RETFI|nr:hypothetical protein RFI_01531 [Reticulomyxa filosa]|eukprot:ETO35532.1 hypothetical protein RFI_01531 [Reticulomyxa filosa]